MELTEREVSLISHYVTNPNGKVFCLTNLDPEITGAALARYSRSHTGIKETILREFLDEQGKPSQKKGSELIDRVLNKFGDDSVGELAGTWLCLEGISNLMTKIIEDRRIGGSPIEESTRYVLFDKKIDGNFRYVRPQNVMNSNIAEQYVQTMNFLFESYTSLIDPMKVLFSQRLPESEFCIDIEREGKIIKAKQNELKSEEEKKAFKTAYNFTIRSAACDVIRCILPAATTANMGIHGNGRFFQGLISRLFSTHFDEAKNLAKEIKNEMDKVLPSFVKRARPNEYEISVHSQMQYLVKEFQDETDYHYDDVELLDDNFQDFEDNIIAEMLFPYMKFSTKKIRDLVKSLSTEKKKSIIAKYIGERSERRHRPGRAFEFGYPLRFDLVGSFAEYRDIQRHRILTQQRQALGIHLGFSIPEEIIEIQKKDLVLKCFEKAEQLYQLLYNNGFIHEAQYAVLFNHYIRWSMGMNIREASHLLELRTIKSGHPKYRRLCQKMAHKVIMRYPAFEKMLQFVDYHDYDGNIARAEQEARTAYKSLKTHTLDDVDL